MHPMPIFCALILNKIGLGAIMHFDSLFQASLTFPLQTIGLAWKSMFIQRMRDRAENSHHYSTVCMLLVHCAPGAACTTTTHHWQPQWGFTAIASEPSVTHDGHRNKLRIQLSRLLAFLSAVGSCDRYGWPQHLLSYLEGSVCRVGSRLKRF